MNPFTILPAVDIQYGQAVQLERGVSESQKVFGDPLDAARRWYREGATWLHLVDLDAAFGRASNAAVVARIVAESGLRVQVAGGIRDDRTLAAALATGAERVVIGTAAVANPAWCDAAIQAHGERIAVALDVRGERLATHGWTATGPLVWDTIDRLNAAGCRRLIITDVEADGTLTGVNAALLRAVAARTTAGIIASGGVAGLADVRTVAALADIGVEGVIIGTALYLGKVSLADALATRVAGQTR